MEKSTFTNDGRKREFRIGVVQMSAEPGRRERNLRVAENFTREAARRGAELVVLPELFSSGYSYDLKARSQREPMNGPTFERIRGLARELNIWLGGCVYEDAKTACFDTFFLAGPDGMEFSHRKRSGAAFESAFFEGGCDPLVVDKPLGRIALVICKESTEGELLREVQAARPNLVLIAYSSPGYPKWISKLPGAPPMDPTRQIAAQWARVCGVPVASACITGNWPVHAPLIPLKLGAVPFFGQSCILDAKGEPLAVIDQDEGAIVETVALGEPSPIQAPPAGDAVGPVPRAFIEFEKFASRAGGALYMAWRRSQLF